MLTVVIWLTALASVFYLFTAPGSASLALLFVCAFWRVWVYEADGRVSTYDFADKKSAGKYLAGLYGQSPETAWVLKCMTEEPYL